MRVLRNKFFSGYSEVEGEGISYYPAIIGENTAEYLIDPLDGGLEKVEKIVEKTPLKKKVSRFRGITKPLSQLLKRKKNKPNKNKK